MVLITAGPFHMNNNTRTYDPSFFKLLKKAEKHHFWYRARRKWILDRVRMTAPPPAKLLEVGCGTGNVSSYLSQNGYQVTGCEYHQEAIDMAWPGFDIVRADALNLPFADRSFDILGLFDVLEHFDEDISILREAHRAVKEGGIIVITVPAREELWSHFDELSHHKRRYTKKALHDIISQAGLNPLSNEYMFMSLYLPAKHLRKRTDLSGYLAINPLVNTLSGMVAGIERTISNFISLPVGTSLIATAVK